MADAEYAEASEDAVEENDLPRGGHAYKAGVGESDGSGEEPRVNGGEFEALLSVIEGAVDAGARGARASLGGPCS